MINFISYTSQIKILFDDVDVNKYIHELMSFVGFLKKKLFMNI